MQSIVLDAYLGLGEGWLVVLLGIVALSVVVGLVFIGVGIRRLSRATGPGKMWGLLLVVAGILLPVLCFFGISSIV
jgi:hypothetical protein